MCRPEKPLTTSNKALRELQEWLREIRARTGLGYRALSVRAGCHATTLQRAASGETVPKLHTVLNYVRACDASPEKARLLWKRARYEAGRLARGGRRGLAAPSPWLIRDFVDLSAALREMYAKAGSPPLRAMEQRAGGYGLLPRSTAHRIVAKRAMPHGFRQFQAYLRACEVPEADWPDWQAAWTRAWRYEKRDEFAALGAGPSEIWWTTSKGEGGNSFYDFALGRADVGLKRGHYHEDSRVRLSRAEAEVALRARRAKRSVRHLSPGPGPGQLAIAMDEPVREGRVHIL
ncbi:helix-turn-helix domain-containing protein [Streptomyces alanosinicus]|uniref:HTH cro/C1-type domain-containing protein n=1 Tax=Streptomyces alanosinicus TaxID=68171 RepID=A0A918YTZ3_9ACTN|nr:helix-turn-helix transcriptional regulator [Streptomyces alanosinicus]GHE15997.1 hypothetical protein GCM10010339_92440 [Streptomyces alanosinicus]